MAPGLIRQCKSLLGAIGSTVKYYLFDILYNDIDGVMTVQEGSSLDSPIEAPETLEKNAETKITFNPRYLTPFLFCVFYYADILYLLVFTDFKWDSDLNGNDHVPLGRKLLPERIAKQTDVFWNEIVLVMLCLSGRMLFQNMEPFVREFRMIAVIYQDGSFKEMKQSGIVLPTSEGEAIFKRHLKGRKVAHLLAATITILCIPFYNLMVALNWSASLTDVKASLWISCSLPYWIMHIYATVSCFVFNCRYLRVRQRYQMNRLESLIGKSNRSLEVKAGLAKRQARQVPLRFPLHWAHFSDINRHLNHLSLQITGYSTFWTVFLSVYFAGLGFLVTYMAFLLLKLDKSQSQNIIGAAFLLYFASVLLGLLLWITLECSVLVVNNRKTLKLQRIFTVHTSLAGGIPLFAAVKFDHIEADSKSIGRIGFKLLDSVQVNSKMFEMLIFYISSLFMKIVQEEL